RRAGDSKIWNSQRSHPRHRPVPALPPLASRRLRSGELKSFMDKRALIGIALSIFVLVAYQTIVTHFYGAPPSSVAPENQSPQPPTAEVPDAAAPAPAAPKIDAPPALPPAKGTKEITVDTDNYIAVFTTQGARLKSFKFKKYRSSVDEHSPPFEIVRAAPGVPLPLGVRWQTPAPFNDEALVYAVQGGDLKLSGAAQGTLVFQGRNDNGVTITKSFTFSGAS